ncbi:MAG: class I SAM-dependent methyltransferase [Myxococcota bacterium]|nr:class I SAM-dependent methyltransferase [Myxococcota bacterium]
MLKFGICTADALAEGFGDETTTDSGSRDARFLRKFAAVSLYARVAASDRPDRDALLERILVRFPTRNASLKRTQSRRFEEFDAAVADLVRERCHPGRTWQVHDAAVSDGRTAVDFFALLDGIEGCTFQTLASDYAPDVEIVADRRSRLEVARDPVTGTLLQVIWPPFVFNVQQAESPVLYPLNHLIRGWLLRSRVPDLLERAERGEDTGPWEHVWLLHPRCAELRERDPRFDFARRDLLAPSEDRYDLVRAMNVLNPSYFDEGQLGQAVANVAATLREGGLFVTGSNADAGSTVDGAVYERTADGFVRCFASGQGSPVDALVTSLELEAPSDPPEAR